METFSMGRLSLAPVDLFSAIFAGKGKLYKYDYVVSGL
jgi:hypothetical protein